MNPLDRKFHIGPTPAKQQGALVVMTGSSFIFRNVMFLFLEYQVIFKVQETSNTARISGDFQSPGD
jgi:hypothetical protein